MIVHDDEAQREEFGIFRALVELGMTNDEPLD